MIAIDLIKCPRSDTIGTRQARPSYGCAGTICPGQTVWLRRLKPTMLGYEKLALQGFGHDEVAEKNADLDESRYANLAGDMFNLASLAEVKNAVFATIPLSQT